MDAILVNSIFINIELIIIELKRKGKGSVKWRFIVKLIFLNYLYT